MSSESSLERRLGGVDATSVGVGPMIGAGVVVVVAPAAAAAGSWLPLALVIAAFVAYCNASASAQLAQVHPDSGGTYVYGRKRLGDWAGFLAGWSFITGKTASCAAMALTFGLYVFPDYATAAAVAAVLVFVIVVAFDAEPIGGPGAGAGGSPYGVLQAAGLFFFAFAGYARIATMGEEVREPRKLIPLAIFSALLVTFVLYLLIGLGLLRYLGPELLASTEAPLREVMEVVGQGAGTAIVGLAAMLASLGALLALVAGVGRTVLAMSRDGELPRLFAKVSARYKTPWAAELAVAAVVVFLLLTQDVLAVVGFSSFGVLIYYSITNAAALTLKQRPWHTPRLLNFAGLAGCLLLAFTLPLSSVATMVAVLAVGMIGRAALVPLRRQR